MPRCYLALGGNLGNVRQTFDWALDALGRTAESSLIAVSTCHETHPVGEPAGTFLNAAVEIETCLAPLTLLDRLQAIEHELGRVRTVRWAPRTIDLDLIFYESETIDTPRLTVPHPAVWYRRFVLDPLSEIAPGYIHPVKRVDIKTLRDRLLERPLEVAFVGGEVKARRALARKLGEEFPSIRIFDDHGLEKTDAGVVHEPALTIWLGNSSPRTSFDHEFDQLPQLSRIDATKTSEPVEAYVKHVLQSALG
jgi:2-amino-4-hydroxy-6-hydroxymethyldihydropteridine diphosphokinase